MAAGTLGKLLSSQADDVADDVARALRANTRVYHGTTEPIVGNFRYPLYTTPLKNYADIYANSTAASSIARKAPKVGGANAVYEFDIAPKARIFDATNADHMKMIDDYWQESLSGQPIFGRSGQLDWTDGEYLADFINQRKLPFDVLQLDEGAMPAPDGGLFERGVSALALNENALRRIGR